MIQSKNTIYKISFIGSNLFYIGSAVLFLRRKDRHLIDLRKNVHCNLILQRCFNKYGEESVNFDILESGVKNLIDREQYYIDTLNPAINICRQAANRLGVKHTEETKNKLRGHKHSLETRQKMSARLKGKKQSSSLIEKRISKIRGKNHYLYGTHFGKGKILSVKTREKLSKINKGKKLSKESKYKISLAMKGKEPWNKGIPCSDNAKKILSDKLSGEGSARAKFTNQEADIIRQKRQKGLSVIKLSKEYACDRKTIYSIVNNLSYRGYVNG